MTDISWIKRVAVLGSGTMGLGIAQVAAAGGFETVLYDVSDEQLAKARARIEKNLDKGVQLGKVAAEAAAAAKARLSSTTDLDAARELLDESYRAVRELIQRHSDAELFEKRRYPWTGSTSLGAYLVSNTSSHYAWAIKLIRKSKK